MTRIYLDAMGGDNAPKCTAEGAIEALRADSDLRITLGGDAAQLTPLLMDCDDVRERITVEHTTQVITNHDSPVMAVRTMKDSSIVRGMMAVRDGEADGFVSAGSTGAVLAAGMFRLGRLDGIDRPALAPLMPNGKGYFLLIDSGANVDCKPEYLRQFAIMGDIYMRRVQGMKEPRVGLLNIGAESEKGNQLTKETYPLLKNCPEINFIGSVEARDIPAGVADVIVCEAFVGNVILKLYEGVGATMLRKVKAGMMTSLRSKIGALLVKPALKKTLKAFDLQEYGGAPMLGLNGLVVKTHGSSKAVEIKNSVLQCVTFKEQKINDKIKEKITLED